LLGSLDFKDHDLLKTAGQQIAVFLAQERSQEQLSETRQFEAFSKLTTFLMHDIKNLIAQQELVVGNARRFRQRPEFVDDAFNTIEGSVKRMRRLLERLQGVTERDHTSRLELQKVVRDACAACDDRQPKPRFAASENAFVTMDRDKLNMIVTHAIRNSQDATGPDGFIDVRVAADGAFASIEVLDTGVGMDADFVRNELFKPFSSTKGAQGMGIGAYQIRETVRAAGGEVEVISDVGRGTLLRMRIPLATASNEPPRQAPIFDETSALDRTG
jgi:putative PEP-CTERM system histidine kinase